MSEKQPMESYIEIPVTDQVLTAINLVNAALQHPVVVTKLERVLRLRNVRIMKMYGAEPYVHLLSDANTHYGVQCFYTVETQEDSTPSWFRIMTRRGSWVFSVKWDDERQFTIDLDPED